MAEKFIFDIGWKKISYIYRNKFSSAMNRTDLVRKTRAAADQLLRVKGYISAADVLLAMERLSKENYERYVVTKPRSNPVLRDWRGPFTAELVLCLAGANG